MSCEHCVATIERSVAAVEGVDSVSVDLDFKLVRVGGGDESEILAALAEAGYEADEHW